VLVLSSGNSACAAVRRVRGMVVVLFMVRRLLESVSWIEVLEGRVSSIVDPRSIFAMYI
jgi:hypothetical protein